MRHRSCRYGYENTLGHLSQARDRLPVGDPIRAEPSQASMDGQKRPEAPLHRVCHIRTLHACYNGSAASPSRRTEYRRYLGNAYSGISAHLFRQRPPICTGDPGFDAAVMPWFLISVFWRFVTYRGRKDCPRVRAGRRCAQRSMASAKVGSPIISCQYWRS